MKERPIIFNTENVKAILDGRKTQTRRIVKPQPELTITDEQYKDNMRLLLYGGGRFCPYGEIGDRLWVRENWRVITDDNRYAIVFKDGGMKFFDGQTTYKIEDYWKPSFFLPKWASRITLEITGVRVERLQEITTWDMEAEGLPYKIERKNEAEEICESEVAQEWFRCLWDSLNAKRGYGWEVNSWVWVIEFKKVEK